MFVCSIKEIAISATKVTTMMFYDDCLEIRVCHNNYRGLLIFLLRLTAHFEFKSRIDSFNHTIQDASLYTRTSSGHCYP